jgi:hypothetical protein
MSMNANGEQAFAPRKRFGRAVGFLLFGVVCVASGWLLCALVYPGHGLSGAFAQGGRETVVHSTIGFKQFDVYYPRPYRGKPHLTLTPAVMRLEERPDGFRVHLRQEEGETLTWKAEGVPAP